MKRRVGVIVDPRYMTIIQYVIQRFSEHLGPRLKSVYVKGSVARGDAVWGISDLDLVLAFDSPRQEDTLLKNEVEAAVRNMPGGEALVIQRIADDRLEQMDEHTKAYWIYSSWYDSKVFFGDHPSLFLPTPPKDKEIASAVLSILNDEMKDTATLTYLDASGTRIIAKRILQSIAMMLVYNGLADYVPLLQVQNYPLPLKIKGHIPNVVDAFLNPPELIDAQELLVAWKDAWSVISSQANIH